jgi:hypothetical protein
MADRRDIPLAAAVQVAEPYIRLLGIYRADEARSDDDTEQPNCAEANYGENFAC